MQWLNCNSYTTILTISYAVYLFYTLFLVLGRCLTLLLLELISCTDVELAVVSGVHRAVWVSYVASSVWTGTLFLVYLLAESKTWNLILVLQVLWETCIVVLPLFHHFWLLVLLNQRDRVKWHIFSTVFLFNSPLTFVKLWCVFFIFCRKSALPSVGKCSFQDIVFFCF